MDTPTHIRLTDVSGRTLAQYRGTTSRWLRMPVPEAEAILAARAKAAVADQVAGWHQRSTQGWPPHMVRVPYLVRTTIPNGPVEYTVHHLPTGLTTGHRYITASGHSCTVVEAL